jgi:Domain of unknown function (DUF4124)
MKTSLTRPRLLCIAILLLAAVPAVSAQSIYKCTKAGGQIEYTDHVCRSGKSELIHQASDSEIIHQYIDLGQDGLAKNYANSHHLDVLYTDLLEAHQEKMQAEAVLQANAAKQLDDEARQQALIDQAAYNGRLQGENDALLQQNQQYADQQDEPAYGYAPVYWGAVPPYLNRGHGHDHDHGHSPPHGTPSRPTPRASSSASARAKY